MSGPVYHADLEQGTEQWLQARCGLLTASEMKLIITPTLKIASNEKERAHLYELMAQRISGYVEPAYISDDMLRGRDDEVAARDYYVEHIAPVDHVGFITNSKWGFTLGYSPDALVGDEGLIEIKSRKQKYQVETITTNVMPDDFMIQVQTGLLVSERKWCDFISYCGGLPMVTIRIYPDEKVQAAIVEAAAAFEARMVEKMTAYGAALVFNRRLIATERRIEQEMFL